MNHFAVVQQGIVKIVVGIYRDKDAWGLRGLF